MSKNANRVAMVLLCVAAVIWLWKPHPAGTNPADLVAVFKHQQDVIPISACLLVIAYNLLAILLAGPRGRR